MTALSSGLNFLSGIAVHFGTAPLQRVTRPDTRKTERQPPTGSNVNRHTPLTKRQKKELLDSIRHDDWFE